MPFNPKPEYSIVPDQIQIKDFYDYTDDFITRPPYQRKNVWSLKKKQALLDSLFRRFYIPKIVIREVRLGENRTVKEIIDGQQRIITVQEFFNNKIKLPKSLEDIHLNLSDKYFEDLDPELRRFTNRELKYSADIVLGIEDPTNSEHQRIATEIFWRLQQGESLNFMEIAHARLSSLSRNFIVKFADDITFDYQAYKPIDKNNDKHKLFVLLRRDNNRMQHLQILTRFLILEDADGPTELRDSAVTQFIEKYIEPDGVGNYSFEKTAIAKNTISIMNNFLSIFKDNSMIDADGELKELSREYVIISLFLLIRHIKNNYVLDDEMKKIIHNFYIDDFFPRWSGPSDEDRDIYIFSSNRQMDQNSIETRDQIIRQLFFEYAKKNNYEVKNLDEERVFNEYEKIKIYRKYKGFCQICLKEGLPEKEAIVSWQEYEADHVMAYSKGGETNIQNAQVLCRRHNRIKTDS